eukprot:7483562-Pyramimonas_sp.AAC.1
MATSIMRHFTIYFPCLTLHHAPGDAKNRAERTRIIAIKRANKSSRKVAPTTAQVHSSISRVCTSAAPRLPPARTPAAPRMPRVCTPAAP